MRPIYIKLLKSPISHMVIDKSETMFSVLVVSNMSYVKCQKGDPCSNLRGRTFVTWALTKGSLVALLSRRHFVTSPIRPVSENVQYNCDQCDYKATHKGSLKIHIDSKHRDV